MRSILSKLSLKRRITLSVALGLASILGVFGYVSMWAVQQSTDQIYRERETLARTTARYVDGLMARIERDLGETAALAGQAATEEERRQVVSSHQSSGYTRLALLDGVGSLLWQEPSSSSGGDISSWPCASASRLAGRPAIATLMTGALGRPTGCAAFPLPGGSGTLVAEMDPFTQEARLVPPGSGDEDTLIIEVVDDKGIILASSAANANQVVADHMHLLAPLVEARQSGVRVHQMPDNSRRPTHLVAYAPLARVPQWGVMVEQDQDVALALPHSLQSQIIVLGAIVLLLGSIVAWTDVRRVVKPLGMLTTASARMAAGDLDSSITTTRGDELGELARTFDLMRVRLKDSLEEIGRWNQELEQRVKRRTEELSALFEASQTLSLTLGLMRDERETYAQLTAKIAQVVGAAKCVIALLRGESEVVGLAPGYGVDEEAVSRFKYRSAVLQAPSIVGPRIRPTGDSSHASRFIYAFGGDNAVAVPLQVEGKTTGIIFAGEKAGGFSEHDARLLSIVASQAAVAVENARLYSELQWKEETRRQLLDKVILAQEEERKRISRELHDEVGQALTALVMNLGGIEETMSPDLGGVRERLAAVRDLASETLASIRRLMLDLRPTLLDDLGLIPAISWYAENNLGRAHIRPRVEVAGFQGRRLPVQMETVLFRVVQEAITNVVKHSSATEVVIRLELIDGRVRASVQDNGKGFDAGDKVHGYEGGLGLMGMQERVALLGGSLNVDSRPGHGTSLSLEIPLGELVR